MPHSSVIKRNLLAAWLFRRRKARASREKPGCICGKRCRYLHWKDLSSSSAVCRSGADGIAEIVKAKVRA